MSGTSSFCPYCGTRAVVGDQRFCGKCGKSLGVTTTAAAGSAAPPAAPAAARPTAPPRPAPVVAASAAGATSSVPASWGDFLSWPALTQAGLVALPVLVVWLLITAVVSLPMLSAINDAVSATPQQALFGSSYGSTSYGSTLGTLNQMGFGALGSMLAGLDVQLSVNSFAGSQSASAVGTFGLAPVLTLVLFGVIVARRTRSTSLKRGGSTLGAYLQPALLTAVVTALALYVAALLLTSSIGGSIDSAILSNPYSVAYRGGPTIPSLVLRLFPILLGGAFVGALQGGGWPLLVDWITARVSAGKSSQLLMTGLTLAGYGLAGYLVALAIASVAGVVLFVVWASLNNVDLGSMLPYLPAVAALAPNAIAMLMLAGTGADLGYGTSVSGSASTNAATYSLWSADLVWVVAGIAALLLPGIVAGIVTRGRNASATPGMVAAAGAFAGLIALIVAIVAAPSLSAAASASTGASSGSTKFVFDLGQAVLIGAIITIGSAIAGYRFGGGLAAPVGNQVDRLAGIQ